MMFAQSKPISISNRWSFVHNNNVYTNTRPCMVDCDVDGWVRGNCYQSGRYNNWIAIIHPTPNQFLQYKPKNSRNLDVSTIMIHFDNNDPAFRLILPDEITLI